jgi:Mg-chelatase subunit ChlD
MLHGLVKAGYKSTLKKIARKVGYKPTSKAFFELLGWKQKQSEAGHREVGLVELDLKKKRGFGALSEAEICEVIAVERLSYKETVGRLPKGMGLTPAILAALVPSLSDRELKLLTPTLEELGLMSDPEVQARWEKALGRATDQRGLHVARNVRSRALAEKLEASADRALVNARESAGAEAVHVIFLIDKSGSMEGAIELSKEALVRILAGFDPARLHVAAFDTMGTVLVPKAPTRSAVEHMLRGLSASGGTLHHAAVAALVAAGVRIPEGAPLLLVVVGDEAGETGSALAQALRNARLVPTAIALFVSVRQERGTTVRDCAKALGVGFSEIAVSALDDPYQVPRVLATLLLAPRSTGAGPSGWVEKVMATPLLTSG